MMANKPETAVQGCTFFFWGHTRFVIMYVLYDGFSSSNGTVRITLVFLYTVLYMHKYNTLVYMYVFSLLMYSTSNALPC